MNACSRHVCAWASVIRVTGEQVTRGGLDTTPDMRTSPLPGLATTGANQQARAFVHSGSVRDPSHIAGQGLDSLVARCGRADPGH